MERIVGKLVDEYKKDTDCSFRLKLKTENKYPI